MQDKEQEVPQLALQGGAVGAGEATWSKATAARELWERY